VSARDVLAALEAFGLKRVGSGWIARCPAHEDRKASLTVGQGDDGRALLNCQAGCRTEDVVAKLGMRMADLFEKDDRERDGSGKGRIVATYDYRDEQGHVLYQAVRFDPKDFRQRRPDGNNGWIWNLQGVRRVLYRLHHLVAAAKDKVVWIPEGEKDVEALVSLGFVATCNVGGAGKWSADYSESLRGRSVVVLPDNDKPGEEHAVKVARMLTGIATDVRIVRLPGLPDKGDVSDWLKAGGTAEKLIKIALGAAPRATFVRSPDRLDGEREERLEMGQRALGFGVEYLNHALGGITTRDLVLIGAKTGVGKTELAKIAALHNCREGKRVHYFALEAEDKEIERRMKFQIIAGEYYRTGFHRPPIRYLDWYMGRLDRELGSFEDFADEELRNLTANLKTYYRIDSFTSDDFSKIFDAIKDETDLVILDHLHYVDTNDENENRGYKRTVTQIRDSALKAGKPVIAVAHVRKSDRRYETLLPGNDDFHGSSDITKIATKAVMLAPAFEIKNATPFLWNTFMQATKCRPDNSVTRYVALIAFNSRLNNYEETYALGKLTEAGKKFAELPLDELPHWSPRVGQAQLNEGWS
jgi:hypothetical protein